MSLLERNRGEEGVASFSDEPVDFVRICFVVVGNDVIQFHDSTIERSMSGTDVQDFLLDNRGMIRTDSVASYCQDIVIIPETQSTPNRFPRYIALSRK